MVYGIGDAIKRPVTPGRCWIQNRYFISVTRKVYHHRFTCAVGSATGKAEPSALSSVRLDFFRFIAFFLDESFVHAQGGGMARFDAPPCKGEGKGQVVVRGSGRFDGAAAFAFKAAHGGEFLDERFGFREGRLDLKFAEVEGELEAADEVLFGDTPEAVHVRVAVAGVDDDGGETPFRRWLAERVGYRDATASCIDDEAGGRGVGQFVCNTDGSFDDFGIGSAYGNALQVTDRAADCPVGGEGEGAPMFGGDVGDFEDDEGCAIATLAEIEADEEFAFERVAQVSRARDRNCRGR